MRVPALLAIAMSAACGDLFHTTAWSTPCVADPEADGCDGPAGPGSSAAASGGAGGTSSNTSASGGTGGAGAAGAELAACTEQATTLCAAFVTCAEVLEENYFGGNESVCVDRLTLACMRLNFGPGSTFDPDDLSKCTKATTVEAGSCALAFRVSAGQLVPAACIEAGTLADGSPCVDAHQCKGNVCAIAPSAKCGVCATAATRGGRCSITTDCEPNLGCVSGTCKTLSDTDEPCTGSADCYFDLICTGETCAPRATLGEACSALVQNCAPFLICGPSGTCEPWSIAPEGDPCGSAFGAVVTCEGFTACSTDPEAPTCVPVAKDGEACAFDDGMFGPQCEFPARCVDKACLVKDASACP